MSTTSLQHLAIIMDGNRRWARKQSLDRLYSESSAQAIFEAIASCKKNTIPYLSLYAFSLENNASRDEALKQELFAALIDACNTQQDEFIRAGVRVRFIGVRSLYPADVCVAIEQLEQATAAHTELQLFMFFYYGGQQEIVMAAAQLARDVAAGVLAAEAIDKKVFERYLQTGNTPPPDLIIRTGGAQRLSNFLLYQAAYSELLFLECLWPEVTTAVIDSCINTFYAMPRNFGK